MKTMVEQVWKPEWHKDVAQRSIDYWECTDCGFRVPHVQYMSIVIEPTCDCGQKWSWFRSVEKVLQDSTFHGKSL